MHLNTIRKREGGKRRGNERRADTKIEGVERIEEQKRKLKIGYKSIL